MSRRRSLLLVQILLFLLVTLLGIATGTLTHDTNALPWGVELLRRGSLPLAGVIVLTIIGLMVWQHVTEERLALPARSIWDSGRPPFPGLEAFTEQDAAVFFGRDAEVAELVERLHPVIATQAHRLVAVVGPSGAGKSSLIQAGLVPQLRRRRSGWIVLPPVVPGEHPLRSLAQSLATAGPGYPINDVSSTDPARLASAFAELRVGNRRVNAPVLLIVDQAEELITLSGQAERDHFLNWLSTALTDDPKLWIIMIMRSEFLTAFLSTPQARLLRDPVMVGTLSRAALVDVIEQPARQAGLTFDPPTLPQQIATDAGGGDALPLLAYALQELCRAAGQGRVLTADAYRRIGGVAGVLTRQADKVAAELGGTDPSGPVLSTLLMFVTIGENEPTRRRMTRSALTEAQWRVVEAFIAARLLTSNGEGDNAILEVAHEALFRSWAPLWHAIGACADQLRWRADLERWARDWENSGRQDAYLLRDERLTAAQRWTSSDGELMAGLPLVADFLAHSNRSDRATMQRLSETVARQALGAVDHDPDYSLLLALAAFAECAPTALALRALMVALVAVKVRVILRGHDDHVFCVAWSPDGQRLATASRDHTARIWDATAGTELTMLRGHDDWIQGVAWSPDGQRLATASIDQTVRIWDAGTGAELAVLRGHQSGLRRVVWSPDGRHLATGSRDRTARIWDAQSYTELAVLRGHDDEVRGVAWSPDGQRLATGSHDRTVRIWDIDAGAESVVLRGHHGWVQAVTWSPEGQRLATASYDGTARIWDAEAGCELALLSGHESEVRGVAWSPDGRLLASASIDRTVRIWDVGASVAREVLYGHQGWIRWVAWSPDGQRLATASDDRSARIWDLRADSELALLHGHAQSVRDVAWSPDGRLLATASDDQTVRIWDAQSFDELAVVRPANREVAWSPDGRRLAGGSSDRIARIWDSRSGRQLVTLCGHDDGLHGIAWSPDGQRLVTGSRDRTARIWDAHNGRELAVLLGHDDEIRGVAWSPDGYRLATASNDRTARIWDAHSGRQLAVLRGHDDWVQRVAWSPEGQRLATVSRDRTVRVWDARSGHQLAALLGHDDEVHGLAWSPDGRRLVTGSIDRTVRIWGAESGAEVIVVGAHTAGVEGVSWSPDGSRIASASRDRTCRVWDATISIEDIVAKARCRASRELTAAERRDLMLPRTAASHPPSRSR